jgi:WD40 repeat protein
MRFVALCSVCLALGLVSRAAPETADVAKNKGAAEKRTDHNADSKPLPLIRYAQSGVIAFSPDAKTIASGDGAVCLHDLTTGRLLWRSITDFKQSETCKFLVFSPDGRELAAAYKGGFIDSPDYVVLWEVTPERKLHKQRILLERAYAAPRVAFSPDSKTVVSGSRKGTIYLWDASTGKELRHFKGGVAAAFAADGRSLICVSHDGTIRHRQIATGDLVNDKKQAARRDFIHAGQVAFSPDNTRLAVCDEYSLSLKDVETGEVITRIDFQGNSLGKVIFTPDSQTLMVFMEDFVRFIDASTGLERSSLKTPREWTGSFAFSCDGKSIACGEKNTSPPEGLLSSIF